MAAHPDPSVRFEIDPALDPVRLSAFYRRSGRLHIPGFLLPEGAEALYRHLAQEVEWSLVLNDGEEVREAAPEIRRRYTAEQESALAEFAHAGARKGFQFLYECRRVPDEPEARLRSGTLLDRFADFLNSPRFLDFARRLTGIADISWADAQATRYRAGHFLTRHDDLSAGKQRRAAYVVNLTPQWEVDWGGQLQFIDADGHIAEAYVPRFNALNIFTVPQAHAVSYVAPFAGGARYSITGWLRAGPVKAG